MWIGKVIINDTIEPTRKFLERAVLINKVSVSLEVDIANAVKETFAITGKMGFRRSMQFLVATSVSELARNIFQYGNGGVIFFGESKPEAPQKGIYIEACDQGPGIEDIALAMQDHYSTGGTLGLGLPGVKRMMDEFSIATQVGEGTCVTCAKWENSRE